MIFKSSEIRWFSIDSETLWKIFENLPAKGEGEKEPSRTHHYLQANLIKTGVKLANGRYEIKIKSAADRNYKGHGIIEHWTKWSVASESDLIGSIDGALLGDWIALEKRRYRKTYAIEEKGNVRFTGSKKLGEGCVAEFTEVFIPSMDLKIFTFALDAFSDHERADVNLLTALNQLDIHYETLKNLDTFGYPELLCRIKGQVYSE